MSSIRNKDMTTKRVQYAQKIAPKILIKFTLFIVSLLLRRHKRVHFVNFLSAIFWVQNVLYSLISLTPDVH